MSNVRRYQIRSFSVIRFITPESADSIGKGTRILPWKVIWEVAALGATA